MSQRLSDEILMGGEGTLRIQQQESTSKFKLKIHRKELCETLKRLGVNEIF